MLDTVDALQAEVLARACRPVRARSIVRFLSLSSHASFGPPLIN
jgi:hypothetical protein